MYESSTTVNGHKLPTKIEPISSINGLGIKSPAQPETDYEALLEESVIDPTGEELPPQVVMSIGQPGFEAPVGTLGNFLALIGKTKAKKTFWVLSYAAAALLNGQVLLIHGNLPVNQRIVLYFDTEQSRYHVQRASRRIMAMAGTENIKYLKIYALRKYSPDVRLGIIRHAIYNTPNVGLVIIDGIRDLTFDINDSEQAVKTVNHLMKWTEELNLHLLTVLHQNKGDANARGHLGTEIVNKAETVQLLGIRAIERSQLQPQNTVGIGNLKSLLLR